MRSRATATHACGISHTCHGAIVNTHIAPTLAHTRHTNWLHKPCVLYYVYRNDPYCRWSQYFFHLPHQYWRRWPKLIAHNPLTQSVGISARSHPKTYVALFFTWKHLTTLSWTHQRHKDRHITLKNWTQKKLSTWILSQLAGIYSITFNLLNNGSCA